jgi:hypothetical protein
MPGVRDRVTFLWRVLQRGAGQLDTWAGWASLIILILGTAAGIAVPQVFNVSNWLTAVVLLSLFILVVGEGAYRVWRETDQDRKTAMAQVNAQKAEIAAMPPVITMIGGRGGSGGGGGGVAGPGGHAEGGHGGAGYSMLEVIAFAALGSGLPLDYFVRLHGYSPDSPALHQRFGAGGAGGGVPLKREPLSLTLSGILVAAA